MDVITRKTEEVTTTIVLGIAGLKEILQQALGLKSDIQITLECGNACINTTLIRLTVIEKDCVISHPSKRTDNVSLVEWQRIGGGAPTVPQADF